MVQGSRYSDIQQSIENLSGLMLEYLNLKLRNIKLESDRQEFLLNTKLINQKFKDLILITQSNTRSFLQKLTTRYRETIMKQSEGNAAKFEQSIKFLTENVEVVSFNI